MTASLVLAIFFALLMYYFDVHSDHFDFCIYSLK